MHNISQGDSLMRLCLAVFAFGSVAAFAASTPVAKPTFTKDVAPILFNRCVECHRAGEVAPMSLTNYKEVRPWAKSIKERVVAHAMPVWLADPHVGNFRNDRRMSQGE